MEKPKTFSLKGDLKPAWIKTGIDDYCIHYLEGLGIHLCERTSRYDKELDKYVPSDDKGFPGYNAVTTSQIRNFYGEVKRIEMLTGGDPEKFAEEKTAFLLLRPKIAYATARVLQKSKSSRMQDLQSVLEWAHAQVETGSGDAAKQFLNFSNFFEAIVAYHKVYGGRD